MRIAVQPAFAFVPNTYNLLLVTSLHCIMIAHAQAYLCDSSFRALSPGEAFVVAETCTLEVQLRVHQHSKMSDMQMACFKCYLRPSCYLHIIHHGVLVNPESNCEVPIANEQRLCSYAVYPMLTTDVLFQDIKAEACKMAPAHNMLLWLGCKPMSLYKCKITFSRSALPASPAPLSPPPTSRGSSKM